jgi:hypothetical protein
MSGYQVTTPNWFAIQSPALIAQSQIVELLAHYWKPYETEYTTTSGTFTSESVLAGCINVSNGSTPSFATPTAALLIAAIQRRKTALQGVNSVPLPPALRAANNAVKPGFSFMVIVHNSGASTLTITAGSGVSLNGSTATVLTGNFSIWRIVVTSSTAVSWVRIA